VPATISPSHNHEPRRRRGEPIPTSTTAGSTPSQVANIHGELGGSKAAVVVRVIVSVAVLVVPAAPSVSVDGVNEHVNPGGRLAHDSVSVFPAAAAFGVKETVNVADCPASPVAVPGDA